MCASEWKMRAQQLYDSHLTGVNPVTTPYFPAPFRYCLCPTLSLFWYFLSFTRLCSCSSLTGHLRARQRLIKVSLLRPRTTVTHVGGTRVFCSNALVSFNVLYNFTI